jgi:signal transduction histidine kinase
MDALSLRTRLFLLQAALSGSPLLLLALGGLISWRQLWVLAPAAAAAYGVAVALSRPVEELLETAARLRAGELQARALLPPKSDLSPVAEALHGLAGDFAALSGRFEDRVRERTEALTRKAHQLRAVGQVGQQVAAVLEPEALLHFVVRVMRGTFGYDVVAALRRQGDHMILAACAARNQEDVPLGRVFPVSVVLGTTPDGTGPGDGPAPLAPGLPVAASELAVPMRLGDRVVGALVVQSVRSGAFDGEDLFTVQTIAGQVAVALENARLFEAERSLRDLSIAEERNRMAREIHDTLAQGFMGIIMHLRAMQGAADPEAARLHREEAETLARESLQEARRSVWNLQPHRLEGKSLSEALAAEVAAIERRTAMGAELCVTGDLPPLSPAAEAALLRIAQEALHNAMKYARAGRVCVRLAGEAAAVALEVEDDGIGFDPPAYTQEPAHTGSGGFGLPGMAARAHALGGTFAVESAPGAGCRIAVRIPAGRN